MCDGIGKVIVASSPVMDDLRTLDAQAAGDLGGIHQIVEIHLAAHDTTVLGRCSTGWRSHCV